MPTDHTPNSTVPATRLASLAAILAVAVGAMVLIGWAFDIAVLKSILPGWFPMKANAAIGFILTGIALLLTTRPPATFNPQLSTFLSRLARFCGLLAGLIGLLTLSEYIFGWNPGIDQWLFREPVGAVGTSHPGRMAQEAALNFVLLSVALWITGSARKTRWTILASVTLCIPVATLALAATLSYLTPSLGAYGWFGLSVMALHAAMMFAILGIAVIAVSWQPDVLSWSLSRNTTAAFACGMVVLVLIGFTTSRSQFWTKKTNLQIAYSEEVLGNIAGLLIEVIDAQARTRGYVITGDEQFKAHYLEAQASSNVKLDALRKFAASNPQQQQQFARIEVRVNAELQWFQQVVDAKRTGMTDAARNQMVAHGEALLDNLRETFDQIESEHHQHIQQLKQEAESVSRFSYLIIFTGTFFSLLIFMTVIFRLNFAVNEREQKERALREREERYRSIFAEARDGIALIDAESGLVTDCNPEFERQCGRTLAELARLHIWELRAPALRKAARRKFEEILAAGKGESSELGFERPDGTLTPIEFVSRRIRIGNRDYLQSISRDITERKQTEQALRENEEIFNCFMETSPIYVFFKDENTRALRLSKNYEKMLGKPMAELLGKSMDELFPSWLAKSMILDDMKVLKEGKEITVEEELDGRLYSTIKFPIFIEGKPRFLAGYTIDITERKQAEFKLAEQINELRRWHDATLGREMRTLELKHEVNELLSKSGLPPRYPSAEQIE